MGWDGMPILWEQEGMKKFKERKDLKALHYSPHEERPKASQNCPRESGKCCTFFLSAERNGEWREDGKRRKLVETP
jgi:hypothetical protein